MRSGFKLLIAAALMVASHNVPAWGLGAEPYGGFDSYTIEAPAPYDPYSSIHPQDSYVTPHVWGGGYTETYPGRGSITVTPNGVGGHTIKRSGFLPRNRW